MQSKGERSVKDEWEKQKGNAEEKENIGKLTYRLRTFGVPYQIGSRKKRKETTTKKAQVGEGQKVQLYKKFPLEFQGIFSFP